MSNFTIVKHGGIFYFKRGDFYCLKINKGMRHPDVEQSDSDFWSVMLLDGEFVGHVECKESELISVIYPMYCDYVDKKINKLFLIRELLEDAISE